MLWEIFKKLEAMATFSVGTELTAAVIRGAIIKARPIPRITCGPIIINGPERGSRYPKTIRDRPVSNVPPADRTLGLYLSDSLPARGMVKAMVTAVGIIHNPAWIAEKPVRFCNGKKKHAAEKPH